ncbi:DNA repair exonuclease [Aureimonas fodinaquatilis]|uniref:DNA repair exonuclease n=1 Tax=Aureimonas fodinaquatilis TaxID=2565783 RepID=A0A5B0DX44_9HYPH|nr:metallophosphoesterase [Aureimonas fodinaquatilis]KAA0971043.1 DNA repair exonuclease [Aureimonas fodinaquatilis]
MIRILHTADWQVGKPFGSFGPDQRGELRAERFAVVARIAALAKARGCHAVLVAGDAFDDNTISDREIVRTLEAMSGFSGPWILLPGNHDSALAVSVWSRIAVLTSQPGKWPQLIIADKPDIIELQDGQVAVLPAPLVRRHEVSDLTQWFDDAQTRPGAVRIGLAHGAVLGRLPEKAESLNPISDTRAVSAQLDYLALGDWHGFVEIAPRTVYSGTPEPDRYPANRPGHVVIVEIDGPGATPRIDAQATGRFVWKNMALSLNGDIAVLDDAMAQLPQPADTLINLALSGSVNLRERVALEERLKYWHSRLFDLRVKDDDLLDAPDEDDLAGIDVAGFVREAIELLRAKAADPSDPQREAASMALRMAYVEHRRLGGS